MNCPTCGRLPSARFGRHAKTNSIREMCCDPIHALADLAPEMAEWLVVAGHADYCERGDSAARACTCGLDRLRTKLEKMK